jgi:hypothetical protein
VSKQIRKEIASLTPLDLTVVHYGGKLQAYMKLLQERLDILADAPAMHAINYLSRLRLTLVAANGTTYEFNLVMNSKNDLTVATCRRQRRYEQWHTLEAETLAEVQTNVQELRGSQESMIHPGLCLFKATIACQSLWQRLLSQNSSEHNPVEHEDRAAVYSRSNWDTYFSDDDYAPRGIWNTYDSDDDGYDGYYADY